MSIILDNEVNNSFIIHVIQEREIEYLLAILLNKKMPILPGQPDKEKGMDRGDRFTSINFSISNQICYSNREYTEMKIPTNMKSGQL